MGGRGSSGGSGGGGGGGNSLAVNAKMPELSGSAKQIKWAENIRSSALSDADRLVNSYDVMSKRAAPGDKNFALDTLKYTTKDAKVIRSEVINTLSGLSSASAIIDNRGALTYGQLEKLAKLEHKTGEVSAARKKRKKQK